MEEFEGRVFYIKENGQAFECFKGQAMKEVPAALVEKAIFYNRNDSTDATVISERQIDLLRLAATMVLKKSRVWPKSTIETYRAYGIITEAECNAFVSKGIVEME